MFVKPSRQRGENRFSQKCAELTEKFGYPFRRTVDLIDRAVNEVRVVCAVHRLFWEAAFARCPIPLPLAAFKKQIAGASGISQSAQSE